MGTKKISWPSSVAASVGSVLVVALCSYFVAEEKRLTPFQNLFDATKKEATGILAALDIEDIAVNQNGFTTATGHNGERYAITSAAYGDKLDYSSVPCFHARIRIIFGPRFDEYRDARKEIFGEFNPEEAIVERNLCLIGKSAPFYTGRPTSDPSAASAKAYSPQMR